MTKNEQLIFQLKQLISNSNCSHNYGFFYCSIAQLLNSFANQQTEMKKKPKTSRQSRRHRRHQLPVQSIRQHP
ncbi:hypothetical protein DERP_010440 [Dermatophagoides pteronyssinus]|uniref:Uncharacterized protein n=1 Tax=Dermatophagoides pteronyssinus TaxID=6956 RepID=A0ABQ8J568_DERPT|nr:hypothetical protein DERP_010440 [Dermatophagoides pteronyssinus]